MRSGPLLPYGYGAARKGANRLKYTNGGKQMRNMNYNRLKIRKEETEENRQHKYKKLANPTKRQKFIQKKYSTLNKPNPKRCFKCNKFHQDVDHVC